MPWKAGAEGRGAHQSFIRGGVAARYSPLRFIYYSWQKKYLFCIPSFEKWYPFHKPSFQLCTPLTAVNMNKSQNQNWI